MQRAVIINWLGRFYLRAVVGFALILPVRIRVLFIIFLSFIENSFSKTLQIVFYFLQGFLNRLLIFFTYYLGIGMSSVIYRILRMDYLNQRGDKRNTFWSEKEMIKNAREHLKRQF